MDQQTIKIQEKDEAYETMFGKMTNEKATI